MVPVSEVYALSRKKLEHDIIKIHILRTVQIPTRSRILSQCSQMAL